MSRTRSNSRSIVPILILAAAIALWAFDAYREVGTASSAEKKAAPQQQTQREASTAKPARTGGYETFSGCTIAADKGNDGDSFRVNLPDGRREIFRLYFVDCPESAFKTYGGGRNNHGRIGEQAEDMGGITPEQVVEIGKKAREFTLTHLGKAPFTLHTEWDDPFNDKRYHGFITVSYNGKPRFLHELLVEKGYARIHTKGAQLPDGTSRRKHESHLHELLPPKLNDER